MIIHREPLSMTEAIEYIEKQKDSNDNEADIKKFIKKFVNLRPKEAKEIKKKLSSLELIKLKKEYLAKIIDILPEDSEGLNKIFTDINLDEDETKKILDTIEEFK